MSDFRQYIECYIDICSSSESKLDPSILFIHKQERVPLRTNSLTTDQVFLHLCYKTIELLTPQTRKQNDIDVHLS